MTTRKQTRESVSKAYARAVSEPAPRGGCCSGPVQKGVAVKTAGYQTGELDALPSDAVVNSFGCGNPLAFGEVQKGDTVLDLGSGAGIDLLLAAIRVGDTGHVIGVDMTDEMIARAQDNIAASRRTNVEVRKGIIEELPVEASSVDWVISNCVINLSPEKPRVFAEIARVLKPGGAMLVSDIVVDELPEALRRDRRLYASCIAGAISEAEYVAGLKQAGLVDVEVRQRIVYDGAQLESFVRSEVPDEQSAGVCCGGETGLVSALAESLAGKIWSAQFAARKPTS